MRIHRMIVLVAIALAGCATSYRSAGMTGGYTDVQVDRNVFRITYKGNASLKQAETDELALLRGAEVSLAHGFPFFVSGGSSATGTAMSIATNVVSVPATTITIYCYPTRVESSSSVYDAREVVATLGPKYGQP